MLKCCISLQTFHPHPIPPNSQKQGERESCALFSVIMSRQDPAWPAGYDENGKQMDSKFLKRSVQSIETERKSVLHPCPFPLLVLPDISFVLFSISLRLKCWSPSFWKWCHFFFSLPWQRASSLQICCATDGFEEIRQRGKTHLGKVWNSRDSLTIKLAVREMMKDKDKQRLAVNISSVFSFTVIGKLFLFPW